MITLCLIIHIKTKLILAGICYVSKVNVIFKHVMKTKKSIFASFYSSMEILQELQYKKSL